MAKFYYYHQADIYAEKFQTKKQEYAKKDRFNSD